MDMTNTRIIPASPDKVWAALNDPAVLKAAIPGCDSFEATGDGEWRAVVAAKVGPVSARFTGNVKMTDRTPPTGYTLKFEGQGGAAGFASGEAKVTLSPAEGETTELAYTVSANVGGKIAQIGSRLIDGAAAKIADEFFERFSALVAPAPAAEAEAPMETVAMETGEMVEVDAGRAPGGNPMIRWISLAIIAAIVGWLAVRGFR